MKISVLFIAVLLVSTTFAQKPAAKKIPDVVPVARPSVTPIITDENGIVSGRTYTNSVYRFRITFPETWLIPGSDFEGFLKSQGFDLSLKPPDNLSGPAKIQVERSLENVKVLVTGFRTMPGSTDNAIMRVAVEDLTMTPQVKDAVDYFDLMRSQFAAMKMPADFKYSETQAEKLGAKQFGFLDTSSKAGKKRMYATVRNGVAIIFTLSYTKPEDLASMRQILAGGDFKLQNK
ncbi:MAG: hypothetical protein ACJ72Z_12850 [Pyrinomonadaceae bacterium]